MAIDATHLCLQTTFITCTGVPENFQVSFIQRTVTRTLITMSQSERQYIHITITSFVNIHQLTLRINVKSFNVEALVFKLPRWHQSTSKVK